MQDTSEMRNFTHLNSRPRTKRAILSSQTQDIGGRIASNGLICLSTFVLLSVALFMPRIASASTVQFLTDRQMAGKADIIAFGKVVHTEYVVDKYGIPLTRGDFQVYYGLKNAQPGDIITMQVPGGERNGLVASAAGAPKLKAGQLWFGYFHHAKDNTYRPLGMLMGLLPVLRNTIDIRQDSSEASLASFTVRRAHYAINALDSRGRAVSQTQFLLNDVILQDYIVTVRALLKPPDFDDGPGPNSPLDVTRGGTP